MRRPELVVAVVAVVASVAAFGVAATVPRTGEETIKPPILAFEQNDRSVVLRIHNRNRHWGLRDQKVYITVFHDGGGAGLRSYGGSPDGKEGYEGRPELGEFPCCVIHSLRPGGDYTFYLFPSRFRVTGMDVELVDGGWVKM